MNPEMQGNYVEQPFSTGKVIIRDGCWLGSRVSVLAGVTIGKRCIIGTNSVVTNDIPPFSIAAGIPARVIKRWNFETHKWDRV
ncbi:MAG: acyltransferase [Lachnospiraceae bacterium]|nr:acyltransferase [Lachnospiraceae bacterium]